MPCSVGSCLRATSSTVVSSVDYLFEGDRLAKRRSFAGRTRPTTEGESHKFLYDLFRKLGKDFNGDLFSDNLDAEARLVSASYIDPLDDFLRATDIQSGQSSFWPYDFAAIPIEAISAIYERFLKGSDKLEGAFYTPRFLAELVLDVALRNSPSLLGRRCLDPACGSGIFLVGLFNRMAEEWMQANPEAKK